MNKTRFVVAVIVLCFSSTWTFAQGNYVTNWFARVDKTQAEQPHWVTPLSTTTPRLEEEVRYDQFWQQNAKGVTTNNYDGGKGLELIPFEKVEVIFNVPPYINHNNPAAKNGFGDVAFLVKYRLLSANETHGNYILTAFLGWSVPTGSHTNGLAARDDHADDCLWQGVRAIRRAGNVRHRVSHCRHQCARPDVRLEQHVPVSGIPQILARGRN